jgi:hypothetical protein
VQGRISRRAAARPGFLAHIVANPETGQGAAVMVNGGRGASEFGRQKAMLEARGSTIEDLPRSI